MNCQLVSNGTFRERLKMVNDGAVAHCLLSNVEHLNKQLECEVLCEKYHFP